MIRHKRIDFDEDDSTYLKLIRINYAIWRMLFQERRARSNTPAEERAYGEAIDIMVRLKDDRKAILRAERLFETAKLKERLRPIQKGSPR